MIIRMGWGVALKEYTTSGAIVLAHLKDTNHVALTLVVVVINWTRSR
jgi:hypothetical protein